MPLRDALRWEPLASSDLAALDAIARAVHPSLPERIEVFAEKRALFPDGARKLVQSGTMVGYGVAHPWIAGDIPPLDRLLESLPPRPDCLYLHDIALLPEARGQRAAERYVDHLRALCRSAGLRRVACVSVYGTVAFWQRFGFERVAEPALAAKLRSYGADAAYLTAALFD